MSQLLTSFWESIVEKSLAWVVFRKGNFYRNSYQHPDSLDVVGKNVKQITRKGHYIKVRTFLQGYSRTLIMGRGSPPLSMAPFMTWNVLSESPKAWHLGSFLIMEKQIRLVFFANDLSFQGFSLEVCLIVLAKFIHNIMTIH